MVNEFLFFFFTEHCIDEKNVSFLSANIHHVNEIGKFRSLQMASSRISSGHDSYIWRIISELFKKVPHR